MVKTQSRKSVMIWCFFQGNFCVCQMSFSAGSVSLVLWNGQWRWDYLIRKALVNLPFFSTSKVCVPAQRTGCKSQCISPSCACRTHWFESQNTVCFDQAQLSVLFLAKDLAECEKPQRRMRAKSILSTFLCTVRWFNYNGRRKSTELWLASCLCLWHCWIVFFRSMMVLTGISLF